MGLAPVFAPFVFVGDDKPPPGSGVDKKSGAGVRNRHRVAGMAVNRQPHCHLILIGYGGVVDKVRLDIDSDRGFKGFAGLGFVEYVHLAPIGILGRRICTVIGVEQGLKAGLRTGDAPAGIMSKGVGVKVFHPFQKGPIRAENVIGLHTITPF
jgi:hypothetical protein